ncbi:RhsD protein [Escherichia coli]|uniref:RhsD protein n=1 Tax=Escherichia coli TaxID=562 RepID=A0A376KUD2_ECOLX|nr:RhsD protein [Escherichia coli]
MLRTYCQRRCRRTGCLPGLADRFGRTLTYRREAAGDLAGEITGVTDGAGREFRLVLTTQAQRRKRPAPLRYLLLTVPALSQPPPFPDTLPGTEYGPDRGIRLSAVWLMHDPAIPGKPARCATGAVHVYGSR